LPPEKKMVVRDQTDDSMVYNNIPAKVDFDNMELNEEQVEAVTGGKSPIKDFLIFICPTITV
jgi:hypothetical protein